MILYIRESYRQPIENDTVHLSDYYDPLTADYQLNVVMAEELYQSTELTYADFPDYDENIELEGISFEFTNFFDPSMKLNQQDYFSIASQARGTVDLNQFRFEIDTTFAHTVFSGKPPAFISQLYTDAVDSMFTYSIDISADSLADINPAGELAVNIYYLAGCHTIRLNKQVANRPIVIDEQEFVIDRIERGRLFVTYDKAIDFSAAWNDVRFAAFDKSGRYILTRE